MKPIICICGHFGGNKKPSGGQTIKTKILYDELVNRYSSSNVFKIDTYNWKKRPISLLYKCIASSIKCTDIVILPAHKGVKIFVPLFNLLSKLFNIDIHYVIIGAWLPELIKNSKILKNEIKKVHYIYAETNNLIKKLNKYGIKNTYHLRNFKNLEVSSSIYNKNNKTIKCCIFSRIEKNKGINDAINVINRINGESKRKLQLDIYGQIDPTYKDEFNSKIKNQNYISYVGIVDFNKSVEIIQNYNLLLFPTRYKTEGIPATIIDSFFSGVPVISSKWDNFNEVIEEGKTGFGYEMFDNNDFYLKIKYAITHMEILEQMSDNCKKVALKYTPKNTLDILFKNIEK